MTQVFRCVRAHARTHASEYLRHLVPSTIQSTTIYLLRNRDLLIVPFSRLSITNSSFIRSTVKEQNKLDIAIRKLDSLSKFKNALPINSQSNKTSVPVHIKKIRTTSFLIICTKYSEIRNDLFLNICNFSQLIKTSLLTSGSETLRYADKFYLVFQFIKRSKRFLIV